MKKKTTKKLKAKGSSRKPKVKQKSKPKKKAKPKPQIAETVLPADRKAGTLADWADIILRPKAQHAADQVDLDTLPIEELMALAARECSCIRLQRSRGVTEPVCSGECSHAKAVEKLSDRGIIA